MASWAPLTEFADPSLNIKKELFKHAMKGEWEDVKEIYEKHPEVHNVKITRSGDTALHVAVSDGQEYIVEQLVTLISRYDVSKSALTIGNERENTPLHLAASMGSVRMCWCIAKGNPYLIGARNIDSETPLFLAALNGRKAAFLYLHALCGNGNNNGESYCRRSDGETVLHVAISGEYFDLAFQIIHLYENFVDSFNEKGLSPLHLLANKPSSFRSGSRIGRLRRIIYHCIYVEDLVVSKGPDHNYLPKAETHHHESNTNHPENYHICIFLFQQLWKAFSVVGVRFKKGNEKTGGEDPEEQGHAQGHEDFPSNYLVCIETAKFIYKAMLIVLGFGSREVTKIQKQKEKHKWSVQIMKKLLDYVSPYEYEANGRRPQRFGSRQEGEPTPINPVESGSEDTPYDMDAWMETTMFPMLPPEANEGMDGDGKKKKMPEVGEKTTIIIAAKNGSTETVERIRKLFPLTIRDIDSNKQDILQLAENVETPETEKKETPILVAAKNGITEMVERILELFPVAIHDMNTDKKNIVLLAVENRQPHVYKLLIEMKSMKETVFRKVDKDGNSALHLAAMLGKHRPWLIPGAALQMQWELKWYEFVKSSMPLHFFARYNKKNQTPKDIFTETHNELIKSGGEWLTNTSESCSVVAALIATVAFATSTTVPGGNKGDSGKPALENEPAFNIFAVSSLVALCFSVTAVVMFLSILTSRYQEKDFSRDLPRKLLVGLTTLFVSIAAMLVSFCAGHFFVLRDKLKYAAFPVYAVTCLPVTFFAMAQFPLYFDLIWATFKKVPQRSYKVVPI